MKVESCRDPEEGHHTDVAFAPLDPADVVAVKPRALGEFLLTEITSVTLRAHRAAKLGQL